jgi:hypothetical protein
MQIGSGKNANKQHTIWRKAFFTGHMAKKGVELFASRR